MSFDYVLLISFGLAMDAFAVSVSCGLTMAQERHGHGLRVAAAFGVFQAVMAAAGWLAGSGVRDAVAAVDHWIAFGFLAIIGGKMIRDAFSAQTRQGVDPLLTGPLLLLAVATSIDALAVGFGMSVSGQPTILFPSLMIGAVTFALSLAGVYIGRTVGHVFERSSMVLGGLILIFIGGRILASHLFA